jgi:hypothetical protein
MFSLNERSGLQDTGIVYKIYVDSDIPYLPYLSKDYDTNIDLEEEVLFPGNLTFTILSGIQSMKITVNNTMEFNVNMVEARLSMDEELTERYIEERNKLAIKLPNDTPLLCKTLTTKTPERRFKRKIEKFFSTTM